jgi:hypothetical protein
VYFRIARCVTSDHWTQAADFVNLHHSYIRWADRPSRKLYWNLFIDDIHVGVFGLSSAFVRPKVVMTYMKLHHLSFNNVANNIVYCLATDVRNAGTRFLAMCRKDAKVWWKERYGDDLLAFQTFILPPRTGAVYKADNWIHIGRTIGKSKNVRTLYGDERIAHPEAEIRTFKNGEVKYLLHGFSITTPKLIFFRLS